MALVSLTRGAMSWFTNDILRHTLYYMWTVNGTKLADLTLKEGRCNLFQV
jgi:hypothetical protein